MGAAHREGGRVVLRRDLLEGEKRKRAAIEKEKEDMEREKREMMRRLMQYEETTKKAERGQDAQHGRHDYPCSLFTLPLLIVSLKSSHLK